MADRYLDPVTGDFVAAARGGFQSSENIENQIAFSFLVPLGSWEGDPELGHRFAELDRATDTAENRARLGDVARDAIKWLMDLGAIERVSVTVESYRAGAVAFQVDYYTPGSKTPKKAGPFLISVGGDLMAFPIPTREQLFSYFIGDYAAAQPEKNVARGSDPYRLGRVVSGAIWTLLAKLLFFVKQALPDTAEEGYLERWGGVYAFPRLPAAGATATLGLRVTGDVGAPVTVDSELAHEDGTLYKVTTDGAVIGAGGYVDVNVAATSTGVATNKGVGELLTFTSPPLNVDAEATVIVKLQGGLDIEAYEDYRVRLLAHIGDPPQGGAVHDYIEWLKQIPGVKDAYIWAHRRGTGTIDLAILGPGTGAARIVSADVELAADTAVESLRPAGARDFVILTPNPVTTNVKCTIEIDEERYGWDWDDAGVGYAITAYDSNASTITVPTLPASVVAGMRIQVRGEEALITLRVGNVLTLSFEPDYDGNAVSWFVIDPVVTGQDVRASGDLVKPVKNAILALFNTLGPARFISAASPDGYARTSWSASLKLSKLNAAITDVDGVDDCAIIDPVITTIPVDDLDATTIDYLSPVKVEVLKP